MISTQGSSQSFRIAQQERASGRFRRIGQGFCGSVWAAENGTVAMKREDGGPGRSLANDFKMHQLVLEMALIMNTEVCVPRWPMFFSHDHSWWDFQLSRFPPLYTPCNVLCSERIPPLSSEIRNRIIDRFCPSASIAIIKGNDADRDCLVRLYLGRRKIQNEARRGPTFFSLRNYPLHLNQAEDLGLPIHLYAQEMAEMLAIMHWAAKIDANDVEFVLGGVRMPTDKTCRQYEHSFLGTHSLWILDFDCCKPISLDDSGIEQAARAFLRNDPYFPRPTQKEHPSDHTLWAEFSSYYLEQSRRVIAVFNDCPLDMPNRFIARVIQLHQKGTRP
ncbi:hypothetical protein PV10_06328 [Exophiala mesophila]|uniref:DUF3669 domain-containing protein n=1 Tax=Exophiala mesophila TaxID=212818 RepID=A0A0D1XUF4_EXOME|nr:uncharacterized protein PV10_06328 [Exophiala mesophila]KIV91831.1 hypothetical protein PV10_06328 [Exophiala mesophila]